MCWSALTNKALCVCTDCPLALTKKYQSVCLGFSPNRALRFFEASARLRFFIRIERADLLERVLDFVVVGLLRLLRIERSIVMHLNPALRLFESGTLFQ